MQNPDHSDTPVDSRRAHRGDKEKLAKTVFKYVLGAGGLVFFVAVSIAVSNVCLSLTIKNVSWEWLRNEQAMYWFGHGLTSFILLIVLSLVVLVFDFMTPKWALKQAIRLEWAVDKLAGRSVDGNESEGLVQRQERIVRAFTNNPGALENPGNGIIESLRETLDIADLIRDQLIFYKGDPNRTMKGFICHRKMIKATIRKVRLVGTMLGSGDESYSITTHIANLTRMKLNTPGAPSIFTDCRVVLPGNGTIYPVYGRFFALDTLLKIKEVYGRKSLPGEGIKIRLRFKHSDVFPAWHLWGDEGFLFLSSIGSTDKRTEKEEEKSVADALPIAIGARRELDRKSVFNQKPYNLEETITRLRNHFDNDLFGPIDSDSVETWLLKSDGTIKVMNIQTSVWGPEQETAMKEKMSEDRWEQLCEASQADDGQLISLEDEDNELEQIMTALREIGKIDYE